MIEVVEKKLCTGCSACVSICPTNAISFELDKEGFRYPKVNNKDCVKCGKCVKICPTYNEFKYNNFVEPKVYAGWNKNEKIRLNSTSGGIFTLIAEYIIKRNGYVVAAEYGDDHSIYHTIIDNLEGINKQRQSKYAQSNINDVFIRIEKLLKSNKLVLFCGTPCQIAGLKSYLRKDYKNLILCDFICRGVISPKVYRKYLDEIEQNYNSKIESVQFKNKLWGWNRFSTRIRLKNGDVYQEDRDNDLYMVGYLKYNLYLRPSCHDCKFKSLPRESDLSLGDFWGIGNKNKSLDDNKGTSVILVNSEKGENIFNAISGNMEVELASIDDVVKGNSCLFNSVEEGSYRNYFFDNIDKMTFSKIIKKIIQKNNKYTFDDYIKVILQKIKSGIRGGVNCG